MARALLRKVPSQKAIKKMKGLDYTGGLLITSRFFQWIYMVLLECLESLTPYYTLGHQDTKVRLQGGISFGNSSSQSLNLLRNHEATRPFRLGETSGLFSSWLLAVCWKYWEQMHTVYTHKHICLRHSFFFFFPKKALF